MSYIRQAPTLASALTNPPPPPNLNPMDCGPAEPCLCVCRHCGGFYRGRADSGLRWLFECRGVRNGQNRDDLLRSRDLALYLNQRLLSQRGPLTLTPTLTLTLTLVSTLIFSPNEAHRCRVAITTALRGILDESELCSAASQSLERPLLKARIKENNRAIQGSLAAAKAYVAEVRGETEMG